MATAASLPDLFADQTRTLAEQVALWPQVCLAEAWHVTGVDRRLIPQFTRYLYAAPEWEPLWHKLDRSNPTDPRKRPVVIAKYAGRGAHLDFLLQAIGMGLLEVPRLYAVEGIVTRSNLEADRDHGNVPLPLIAGHSHYIKRSMFELRSLWRAHGAATALRGIGLVTLASRSPLAAIPVPLTARTIHRTLWQQQALGMRDLGSQARCLFDALPTITEATLAALVLPEALPHYELNAGIVERLRLKAAKHGFAPKALIEGLTSDRRHRHANKLTILLPASPTLSALSALSPTPI